jgi:hypothetical protein
MSGKSEEKGPDILDRPGEKRFNLGRRVNALRLKTSMRPTVNIIVSWTK